MHLASYVFDYNYEPKSGPLPQRIFGGVMSGLNDIVWKVTEEQGTKDWFLLRRFMLTSTSAVHMLRKLEKTRDVPLQLKEAADATAYVLKMRVMEPVNDVNTEAVTAFIQFLRASNAVQDETWYNGEYLGRRITVTLMKQALQHLRVPLGGKTNKGDLGHLLTQNLYNTEPLDSEGDTDMALSVL
jgi:hypothetical protein